MKTYSHELMCHWESWRVVNKKHLALWLPPGNSCDMTGAIIVAQFLCPLVSRIDTYRNGEIDTTYALVEGQWDAFRQPL